LSLTKFMRCNEW